MRTHLGCSGLLLGGSRIIHQHPPAPASRQQPLGASQGTAPGLGRDGLEVTHSYGGHAACRGLGKVPHSVATAAGGGQPPARGTEVHQSDFRFVPAGQTQAQGVCISQPWLQARLMEEEERRWQSGDARRAARCGSARRYNLRRIPAQEGGIQVSSVQYEGPSPSTGELRQLHPLLLHRHQLPDVHCAVVAPRDHPILVGGHVDAQTGALHVHRTTPRCCFRWWEAQAGRRI